MGWYVITTHASSEAKAARHLQEQGFEVYSPTITKLVRGAERRYAVFARYVFVRVAAHERWRAIASTRGVRNLVMFGEKPAVVRDEVIEELRIRIGQVRPVDREEPYKQGERLRITGGAFEHFPADFESMTASGRVRCLISVMGREVRVDVGPKNVSRINE